MKLTRETTYGGKKLTGTGFTLVIALITVGVLLLTSTIVGQPLRKTPADQIALSYGGGMFEGAQYQKIVQPGSGIVANGFFDKWYQYPTTQRDVTIATDEAEESKDYGMPDVIVARTKDGVACNVQLAVTFKINTNNIRDFHETIGLKSNAWTEQGWGKMLQKNFLPPLEGAVQEQCRNFTSNEIAKSPEVLSQVSNGVGTGLKNTINGLLGGDNFFCGPEFKVGEEGCPDFQVIIKSITLPDSVNVSLEEQVSSENRLVTAKNEAKQTEEKARGEQLARDAQSAAIADPNYLESKRIDAMKACAGNQNCTLIVTDGATGVNVNAGGK